MAKQGKDIGKDEIIETLANMSLVELGQFSKDLDKDMEEKFGVSVMTKDEQGNRVFPGGGQVASTEAVEDEEGNDTGTRSLWLVSATGQLTHILTVIKDVLNMRGETRNSPLRTRNDLLQDTRDTEQEEGKPQCLIEEVNDGEIEKARKTVESSRANFILHVVSDSTGEVIEVLGGNGTKASGTVGIRIKRFDEDFKYSTRDIIQQATGMNGRDVDDLLTTVSGGQAQFIQVPRHKVEAVKRQLRDVWVGFD